MLAKDQKRRKREKKSIEISGERKRRTAVQRRRAGGAPAPARLEAEADAAAAGQGCRGAPDSPVAEEEAPEASQPVLALADVVHGITGAVCETEVESTIGGGATCIVCFSNPKSHLAAPCGHQSVCGTCSARMVLCPYCREPVAMWVQHRMV